MFYDLILFFTKIIYAVFFRLEVVGRENIPLTGGLIVASNHLSNLDPPTVGTALAVRKVNFMAKEELFKVPLFGAAIRELGAFPVKRGMSDRTALKVALEKLKNGEVLGIFPEGTRSKNGKIGKGAPGGIALAARSGAQIVPTAVIGTNKISLMRPFPKLKVIFGKSYWVPPEAASKEELHRQTENLMKTIDLLMKREKD